MLGDKSSAMHWSIVPRPPRRRLPKEPAAHGAKPVRETLPVRSPPVSTRQQIVFGLLAVAGLVLVLFLMRDVIGPFVLGGLLAFVIEPLVSRLTHS